MDMTPLSIARIAGEVGLAGGTITGGTMAAKYGSQVTVLQTQNKQLGVDKSEENRSLKEIANRYYSLLMYAVGKIDDVSVKTEFSKSKDCVRDFLNGSGNAECIKSTDAAYEKLKSLGYKFPS